MPEQWFEHELPPSDEHDSRYFLRPEHIAMIDEALRSLGAFGEVRLVVEKGRLRYLVIQRSHDVLKWHPGSLVKDLEG